jgi:autotransporter-associated beta strand protein
MRASRNVGFFGILVAAVVVGGLAGRAQAITYIFTAPATSTTNAWSAGTNWDSVPVGGIDAQLTFTGTVDASQAIVSNNDIAAPPFKLNSLTFSATGPGSGTAPTYTIQGNQLEFVNSSAAVAPTMTLSATGTVKPALTISNALLLTNDLAITATTSGTLGGVISGASNLAIVGPGTVTLANTGNTFGGAGKTITVSGGGFVRTNNENSFGGLGSASNKLVLNGGGYNAGGSNDFGTSFDRAIELQTGGTNTILTTAGAASRECWIGSTITGNGGFTTAGTGAPIIIGRNDGTSTLGGTVTSAAHALYVAADATRDALGSAALNINGGNFLFGGNSSSAVGIVSFSRAIAVNSAHGLSASNNYTFTHTGTLTGSSTLYINNITTGQEAKGSVAAINSSGANSAVNLNGDMSGFSGGFNLVNGKLVIGTSATLPSSFGSVTFSNAAGVNLDLNGRSITAKGLVTGGTLGGNIQGNSTTTANTLTIDTTGMDRSYGGIISDGGSVALNIAKIGTNTQTLTGGNSYSGTTNVTNGALNIQHSTGLGSTAAGTSVTAGAALQIQGGIAVGAEALALNGNGVTNTGALRNTSGINTYSGQVTLESASRINSDAGLMTLSNTGTITGSGHNLTVGGAGHTTIASIIGTVAGSLTKDGAGTAKLSGANTYTGGTTVSAGTLVGTSTSALGLDSNLAITGAAAFAYRPTAAGALNVGTGVLTLVDTNVIGTALGGTAGQSAITSSVAATTSGTVTVNVSGIPGVAVTTGANDLITAGGGLSGATYALGKVYNATNFTVSGLANTDTAVSITATPTAALTSEYWKGGFTGGTAVWAVSDGSAASNWASDSTGTATSLTPGPTATINFSAAGAGNKTGMTLGADMNVAGIAVNDTAAIGLNADAYTLTLGTGGITVDSGAGAVTLAAPIALNGNQSWTNNSASLLTVSGGLIGTGNLVLGNGGTLASGITISMTTVNNAGAITNSGAGTGSVLISATIGPNVTSVTQNSANSQLTLSGANLSAITYTATLGTLSISNTTTFASAGQFNIASGGRLEVVAANANLSRLSTAGLGSGVVSGGFLRYSANQSAAGSSNGPGTILGTVELNAGTVSPNYTLDFGAGSTLKNLLSSTYGGAITLSGRGTTTCEAGVSTLALTGAVSGADDGTKTLLLTGTGNGTLGGPGLITNGAGMVNIVKEGTGRWDVNSETGHAAGSILVKQGTFELHVDNIVGFSNTNFTSITLGDPTTSNTNAATLRINGGGNPGSAIPIIVGAGSSGLLTIERYNSASGTAGFSGGITLANNVRLYGSNGSVELLTKGIDGTGNVTTEGSVVLNPANTFTGSVTVNSGTTTLGGTNAKVTGWTVNAGTLAAKVTSALGGSTATITLADGANLTLNNNSSTSFGGGTVTVSGSSNFNITRSNTGNGVTHILAGGLNIGNGSVTLPDQGTIFNSNQTGSLTMGAATLTGSPTFTLNNVKGTAVGHLTLAGVNEDATSRTVTKLGLGNLRISAASTLSGTWAVEAGALTGMAANVFGTAKANLNTGATLNLNNFDQQIAGLNDGTGGGGTVTNSVAGTKTLDLTGSGTYSFSGAISSGTGNIALTKSGSGTQTLSGTNTYTGPTTLSAGTLSVGASANLGAAAANLTFDGGTLQITGTTLASFSGIGHTAAFNAGKTVGLDINAAAHVFTADQVLNQTTGGFSKSGAGTAVLNQTNSYTGVTAVNAGTLRVTGSIASNGATVAPGAVLDLANAAGTALAAAAPFASVTNDGTLNVSSLNEQIVAIAGLGTTHVTGNLTANSIVQDTLTVGAGGSVTIRETTGAAGGASAVPEPGTWVLLAIGLLSLLAFRRRR